MKLLLVEDDPLLADTLIDVLQLEGHRVTAVTHHDDVLGHLADPEQCQDLMLLDLDGADAAALKLLANLRQQDTRTPVLLLTAQGAIETRIRGLTLGADDYLAKPFALEELTARVQALLHRRSCTSTLQLGRLNFDGLAQRFTLGGETLNLPPREFRLLACLMRYAGAPLDKQRLYDETFSDGATHDNGIDVYVHRLRRRLDGSGIELQRAADGGYALHAP